MPFPGSPRRRRGHADLALTGDIAAAETSAMRAQLLAALEGPQHPLTIDMRGVSSVSPQAIAVLISVGKRQQARDQQLTLICSRRSVTARSLNRAGVRDTFRIVSEPPEAAAPAGS